MCIARTSSIARGSSTIESSQPIEAWVASSAPPIAKFTTPVLNTIDSVRAIAAQKLDQGTNWSKSTLKKSADQKGGWAQTLWVIDATAVLYLCSALSYLVDNVGIFYPAFALIFFYVLWQLYRLARR